MNLFAIPFAFPEISVNLRLALKNKKFCWFYGILNRNQRQVDKFQRNHFP